MVAWICVGCDPASAGRSEGNASPGAEGKSAPGALAETSIRDASIIVRQDGAVEIYGRHGDLRARILDPEARFLATLEPLTGTAEWAKPHPYISVPIAGLSDWLTRGAREHRARARLEAEGLTESHRLMVSIAEAAESVELRLAALDAELAALWADASKPAAERRRLLFERWDECEEGEAPRSVVEVQRAAAAPDALRGQAGERAREIVEKFVRAHLPEGGEHAYSREELAQLNRRRASRRPFTPYAEKD